MVIPMIKNRTALQFDYILAKHIVVAHLVFHSYAILDFSVKQSNVRQAISCVCW